VIFTKSGVRSTGHRLVRSLHVVIDIEPASFDQ
jgi:hypothetical protein